MSPVTIENDCGRQVSGVYIKTPTAPGQEVHGTLLRQGDYSPGRVPSPPGALRHSGTYPDIAWILAADATIYPVSVASLALLT